MRRKFLHRIEVYKRNAVPDGSGGQAVQDVKISDSWCDIKTPNAQKLVSYGLNVGQSVIEIDLRYRADLDYNQNDIVLGYKGQKYVVRSVINSDLNNEYLRILAWKE